MDRLFRAAADALSMIMQHAGPHPAVLDDLDEIEVSFIDDAAITHVHGEFLNDPTPTDVITFEHGEVLISTETAIRQAAGHANDPQRECALYLIHGLLHLNGHDDHAPEEAEAMRSMQENILATIWPHPARQP
jgi:probable rRNA maturation factor